MRKSLLLGVIFSTAFAQEIILEEIQVIGKGEFLTEDTVRELPVKDLGEALEYNIPGIWKVRKGSIASDVVIRGFKKDEVNQLFDGARIYNACPNRMDPGIFHIDFVEVENIEIIKGPFDIRNYGAVGGTVNVNTKDPKQGFSGNLNLSFDNWGYFNPSVSLSYGTDRWGLLIGYAFRFSKPYEDGLGRKITELYLPDNPSAYSPEEVNSTAFNIHTLWTKLSYKLTNDLNLKLNYTHQRATDVLYPYLMMDAIYDETDRFNVSLEGPYFKTQFYVSSVRHWMTDQKRISGSSTPLGYKMGTLAKSKVYGFKSEYKLKNLSFGIDTFYRYWEAQTTMFMGTYKTQNTIPDVDVINVGLFWEYKDKLSNRLKLVAGIRVDYTKTQADSRKANKTLYLHYHGTDDVSQTDFYPSGNIQFFYSLTKGLELFMGLGSAVRVPDPQERYFALDRMGDTETEIGDWVGNPKLDPERNTELDIGLKFFHERYSGEFRTFFSYVNNYIYVYRATAPSTGDMMNTNTQAMSYTNIDAYFYGFEFRGTYAISDTLFFDGNIAFTRARKIDTYPEKNIYDKDIAEIPPLTARLALRYDTGNYFGEVETILSSTQNNVDSDLWEQKTSGYGVVNLKTGAQYKNIRLIAGVNNLFDKLYYTHLSYLRNPFSTGMKVPEPGRTFYLTVSYNF
ncbi:MAG TPA: TonB-dependent receptor [Aquifex aeolicus]|nr:TonB-dependent receptor [Aquifex aeolicus]